MKNITIGNQQINDNFKHYLAGMLDGEGSISILKSGKTNTPPIFHKLKPLIQICGTDKIIMDLVIRYCELLNLPKYVRISNRSIKHKPAILVIIEGLSRVEKWIKCFENIEFGKKEKMFLVKEFIDLRKNKSLKHPIQKPYSQREIEIYNTLRILNERGGKSRQLFSPINPEENSEKNMIWKYEKMIELIKKGWTQKKIANFFGVDPSAISKWIKRNYQNLNDYHQDAKSEGIV